MTIGQQRLRTAGLIGAVWGVGGFSIILLDAINRLSKIAFHAFDSGLSGMQWVLVVVVVAAMAYMEGYRGFQKSFSPRSAARAYYLYRNPELLSILLAPLFCMGFFRATRRPLLVAWVGTAVIAMLIIALQMSAQPWRGIIDAGVVVGLSWGLTAFLVEVVRVFRTGVYPLAPEVPGGTDS
jgi:hypothetical protein